MLVPRLTHEFSGSGVGHENLLHALRIMTVNVNPELTPSEPYQIRNSKF